PPDEEQSHLARVNGLDDRVPAAARDRHEWADRRAVVLHLRREDVELATPRLRLRLLARERASCLHLQHGPEDHLVVPREGRGEIGEVTVALEVGEGDEDPHRPPSTSGTTCSDRIRGHACPLARRRRPATRSSRSRATIAAASDSPSASGGTYVAPSPASA